jgi:ABC-2 type transport system permease protein
VNVLPVLIRREFWEHRALWIAPLAMAVLILLGGAFGSVHFDPAGMHFGAGRPDFEPQGSPAVFALSHWALVVPQYFVMVVVLFFYLLDCLYAERKDRSILFWKSLPVSDTVTVLSKLGVAFVVVPLGVYALAIATDLVASGIFALRFHESASAAAFMTWDTGVWLRVHALLLGGLFVMVLWYAPVAAYLLLVSAWAGRHVFLWAVLPPLLIVLAEWIAFRTTNSAQLLGYRLGGIWGSLGAGDYDHHGPPDLGTLFGRINALPMLENVDLWLGVALAAALVFAAIRIRRYRDET